MPSMKVVSLHVVCGSNVSHIGICCAFKPRDFRLTLAVSVSCELVDLISKTAILRLTKVDL